MTLSLTHFLVLGAILSVQFGFLWASEPIIVALLVVLVEHP